MYTVFDGLARFQTLTTLAIMALLTIHLAILAAKHIHSVRILKFLGLSVLLDAGFFVALTIRTTVLQRDAQLWHMLATEAAQFLTGATNISVTYVDGKEGYIWLLGAVYAVGGNSPILALALNSTARLVTVFCIAKSTEVMCETADFTVEQRNKVVTAAAILTAVLPAFAVWAPQVLRESLTIMCVALAATLAFVGIIRGHGFLVLLASLPMLLLVWLRSSLGISVSVALVVAVTYTFLGKLRYSTELRAGLVLTSLVTLPYSLAWLTSTLGLTSDRIVNSTAELSETASSGFPGLGWDATLPQVISITAPRVAIGPFPWEMSLSGAMMLAQLEWLCWIVVLILVSRALRLARRNELLETTSWMVPFFVVLSGAILVGLMLTVANYGILARFRPIATVAVLPIASLGVLWQSDGAKATSLPIRASRMTQTSKSRRPQRALTQ